MAVPVAAPGTVLELPIHLFELLKPTDKEIGGVLLFDKDPATPTLTLNTVTASLGGHSGVHLGGLVKTFGLHPSWFIYHTHPVIRDDRYNGLSGPDLFMIITLSLSSNEEHSIVTHLLVTQYDLHVTYLNPNVYNIFLRIYNGFINDPSIPPELQIPANVDRDNYIKQYKRFIFIEYYKILFDHVIASFSNGLYYNGPYPAGVHYTRDTHALTGLDYISFIPQHEESWKKLMSLWPSADGMAEGEHIFASIRNPKLNFVHNWLNKPARGNGALDVAIPVQENIVGLFKTTSFKLYTGDMPIVGENIRLTCGDGGYIYTNTVPWNQVAIIPPIIGQLVPMMAGGRRKKQKTRKIRKYKRRAKTWHQARKLKTF